MAVTNVTQDETIIQVSIASKYIYRSLPDRHIRLLELLPGAFGDLLCIKLSSVNLEPQLLLPYHALSYTWGSQTLDHSMTVIEDYSRRVLPITQNLHAALQKLRHTTIQRLLWVDAVCINQEDYEERSHQVSRMADIYKSAEKVVIWLGSEGNNSCVAMKALDMLASKIEVGWTDYTITRASSQNIDTDWFNSRKLSALFDDETIKTIVYFLERPWFSRLWIWQEVFMAADRAEIRCGDEAMIWESFRKAIIWLYRGKKPGTADGLRLGRAASRAWQISNMHDEPSLKVVLRRTKRAQCSDQRDRIYAVLNLVNERDRLGIQPDYRKNLVEVFRDLIVQAIFEYWNPTVLSCCELGTEIDAMPSWIPDWSRPRICDDIWQPRACWNSVPEARIIDKNILVMSGISGGRITKCFRILQATDLYLDGLALKLPHLQETHTMLTDMASFAKIHLQVVPERQDEIICRTLCCNEFSDCYEPVSKNHVDCDDTIQRFRKLTDPKMKISWEYLVDSASFLDSVYTHAVGRAMIVLNDGNSLGLAPNSCQENDYVAVLLGCQSPLVLRENQTGNFLVVGESYVHGLMNGEAFLGPLADNWQWVSRYDEETRRYFDAFIDRNRNICQARDPRLGALPRDWCEEEHPMQHLFAWFRSRSWKYSSTFDPRMMSFSLRARGLELREFNLV